MMLSLWITLEIIVFIIDDDAEVVKIRLAMFKQNTLPMLKYFDDKGKLRVVRNKKSVSKQKCRIIYLVHSYDIAHNQYRLRVNVCCAFMFL